MATVHHLEQGERGAPPLVLASSLGTPLAMGDAVTKLILDHLDTKEPQ